MKSESGEGWECEFVRHLGCEFDKSSVKGVKLRDTG